MSLEAWQRALGSMIVRPHRAGAPRPERPGEAALSEAERVWLDEAAESPGLLVMCLMERRERRRQICATAPLTTAALRRLGDLHRLDAYIDAHLRPSAFAPLETMRFLERLLEDGSDPLVATMARFERAVLDAGRSRESAPARAEVELPAVGTLRLHPWRMVVMPGRPEDLIVSVALAEALPLVDRTTVLVGPRIPSLWRAATRAEDVICSMLVRPRTVRELGDVFPTLREVVKILVADGVVSCSVEHDRHARSSRRRNSPEP